MNKIIAIAFLLSFLFTASVEAQWGKKGVRGSVDLSNVKIEPIDKPLSFVRNTSRQFPKKLRYQSLPAQALSPHSGINISVKYRDDEGGLWIEGDLDPGTARDLNRDKRRDLFVKQAAVYARFSSPVNLSQSYHHSANGIDHYKYMQLHQGVPIWGNEVTVHVDEEHYSMLGRLLDLQFHGGRVNLDQAAATSVVDRDLMSRNILPISAERKIDLDRFLEDDVKELVWFPHHGVYELAWHLSYHPNLASRWEYFIGASSGEILHKYESLCKAHNHPPHFFDGATTGGGLDLNGQQITIQTYEVGNVQILLDVSRPMFDNRSVLPNDPRGAIITLDAVNTFPGADDFKYQDLLSNSSTWNNPDAISAHTNAAAAYEYFRQFFDRNSINGQGGNIISLINVADEDGGKMDNAFWNGAAIFYGKGKNAFTSPLARGLDVATHELSHGVIQTTANLNYEGESGALNESFADIFAILAEDVNWQIGEDIVNRNIFRSGALRDLSDPHNGGSSLNHAGYQPAHYSERYTGREDNGGVHINSGIPNHAFYLFATHPDVNILDAEQIYYSVLTNYLTRSSQFVDLRVAVVEAAGALYGASVAQAAREAFDGVGIIGEQSTDYQQDVEVNPGDDAILVTSLDDGLLHLIDENGQELVQGPLSNTPPANPPSVTDDGSLVVYVADDKTIHYIELFSCGQIKCNEGVLQTNPIWSNVAVSKDGTKVAAIFDEATDSIVVFSLERDDFRYFELYNPTTADGDISTADILYADALEWDHSGEFLMYDAFNSIQKLGTTDAIQYWDIGFIRAWDETAENYGDGYITKLFSGLPEEISIGNPTFAKNSPYIIAFDYLDESEGEDAFSVLGVNIETFDVGVLYENTVPGYPSYSRTDEIVIFDAEANDGTNTFDVIAERGVSDDKINGSGDATIYFDDAVWGEWFGNGERALVNVLEGDTEDPGLLSYPNPVESTLNLEADWLQHAEINVAVTSVEGKVLRQWDHRGGSSLVTVDMQTLSAGVYFVKLRGKTVHRILKVIKN